MKPCKVNKDYFVLKAHYFLFNAAIAGTVPFLAVYAKQLGISAVAVGIIYTVLPFLTLVAKPFFGGIADRFNVLKPMLVVFILLIVGSTLGMNFIPMKERVEPLGNQTLFKDIGNSKCLNGTSFELCAFCQRKAENSSTCDSEFEEVLKEMNSLFSTFSVFSGLQFGKSCHFICCCPEKANWTLLGDKNCEVVLGEALKYFTENAKIRLNSIVSVNEILWNGTSQQRLVSCRKRHASEYENEEKQNSHDESGFMQMSVFFVLIIICWVSFNTSVSLSDALCYHTLKEKTYLYGKQRVWGAIGWGTLGALAGYLNNVSTGDSPVYDYSPGFYLLIVLMVADLIAVSKLDHTGAKVPVNILKNVGRLVVKPRAAVFLFGTFLFGGITGFNRTYFFWYLRTLGASQLLLGAASGARCLIGELPFFFFSGLIIRKIGHINTMTMSFFADGVRFVSNSYVQELWWVILFEVFQGGFAAFYASMTAYARVIAPSGTEATMQGLVGGTFEGLGAAAGSLLGGLGFEYFDGRDTFFWAGIFSFIAGVLHAVLQASVKNCNTDMINSESSAKGEENCIQVT